MKKKIIGICILAAVIVCVALAVIKLQPKTHDPNLCSYIGFTNSLELNSVMEFQNSEYNKAGGYYLECTFLNSKGEQIYKTKQIAPGETETVDTSTFITKAQEVTLSQLAYKQDKDGNMQPTGIPVTQTIMFYSS